MYIRPRSEGERKRSKWSDYSSIHHILLFHLSTAFIRQGAEASVGSSFIMGLSLWPAGDHVVIMPSLKRRKRGEGEMRAALGLCHTQMMKSRIDTVRRLVTRKRCRNNDGMVKKDQQKQKHQVELNGLVSCIIFLSFFFSLWGGFLSFQEKIS